MTRNWFSLEGQCAIVTGGSGYLGSRIVQALLDHGAYVCVADPSDLPELLQDEAYRGKVHHERCDVSDSDSIRDAFANTVRQFDRLDILVNGAAYGAGYGDTTIDSMSDEVWDIGVDGTVGTVFRCTRESIRYLRQSKSGCILNIASMYGMVSPDPRIYGASGANNPPNYGAGKSAVLQLTRYCAAHLAAEGIRVNSLSPGPFPDPAKQTDKAFLEQLENKTMLGRIGKQSEVAGAALFLVSPAASYITGVNLPVDGGWTAW